jgi:hypothetical protein
MSGDLAGWRAKLLAGSRFAIMAALRQTLGAAVDWGYIDENPAKKAGKNPQPPPRPVRPYTFAELDTIALELSAEYEPLPDFAAGDRASSRRMDGARAPQYRPARRADPRSPHRLRPRGGRAGEDEPQPPAGAALPPRRCRARPTPRPLQSAAAIGGAWRRPRQPRQLSPPLSGHCLSGQPQPRRHENPGPTGFSLRADDGTRTHDLLHGKQTL